MSDTETPTELLTGKFMEQIEAHYLRATKLVPDAFLEALDALAAAAGLVMSTFADSDQPHMERFFITQIRMRRVQIKEIERNEIAARIARVRRSRT